MRGDRPHSKENRQGNRFTLGPAEQPRRHSLMQSQCELGLKWLKAGEIEGKRNFQHIYRKKKNRHNLHE